MTGTRRLAWLAPVLLLAAAAAPARGADPCAADLARHCAGKAPVDELSCLQSHRNDLAPACRDHLEYVLVSVQVLIQDCEPDAFALCRNVGRGEPTARCLVVPISNRRRVPPAWLPCALPCRGGGGG